MNICLIVVDSLRAKALESDSINVPFLSGSSHHFTRFRHAYATECWTLPTHTSMFTGLLPSEHHTHFQTMGYHGAAPTIAELLRGAGFHTEIVTRNSIFDGTLPGVTRGFQHNTLVLSELRGLNPMSLVLAASKPRFQRQIDTSGFFHPLQRESREFVTRFAQATVPADREALAHILDRIRELRRDRSPFFIFANLYDVHAPYPPTEKSIFRPLLSKHGISEALRMPFVLPRLGGHAYLAAGFQISETSRELLLGRYHTAIELMSEKLTDFYSELAASGALDDTLLIITSDHGEAFGDHDLYLHDSSVWQTHLHVPLYVHHPRVPPHVVDDTVSTRDLFGLLRAAAIRENHQETILDPLYRQRNPIAVAEHFFPPHVSHARSTYRQNLIAAICGSTKVMLRREGTVGVDLNHDPNETNPVPMPLEEFEASCLRNGAPREVVAPVMAHLRSWTN